MVIQLLGMGAGIVNAALNQRRLFLKGGNGELWVVWDRMRTIVPTWAAAFKNPPCFPEIEEACKRPGSLA